MGITILMNFENEEQQNEYFVTNSETISISTTKGIKLLDLLKEKELILEQINNHKNYLVTYKEEFTEEEYKKEQEKLNLFKEKIDSLIDITDMIYLELTYEDVVKYIEENPILKTKKIAIKGEFDISHEAIKEVKEIFKNYPNIHIKLVGNSKELTIPECEKTIDKIEEIANHIRKYNFTPLEQMIYTYDLVRDKIYTEEKIGESYTESRDLTKALFGDKIVCVGYSNVYKAILNKLGLNCEIYHLDGLEKEPGHAINVSYIKDEKYNIDGIYFTDITGDSKTKENDNSYLNSYYFFGKTLKQIQFNYKKTLKDNNVLVEINDIYINIKKFLEQGKIIPCEYAKTLNKLSKIIDNGSLKLTVYDSRIPIDIQKKFITFKKVDKDFILEKTKEYQTKLSYAIGANIMLTALYNVRKVEYYENPSKYPFDLKKFIETVIKSSWIFPKTKEERLLAVIFGEEINKKEIFETKLQKYIENNNLEQNIARIKLTKTLSRIKK